MKIILTPDQLKNLEVFLSRVQLTGAESAIFQDVVRAILQGKEDSKPEIIEGEKNG